MTETWGHKWNPARPTARSSVAGDALLSGRGTAPVRACVARATPLRRARGLSAAANGPLEPDRQPAYVSR
jgi:hypothetical protein